VCGLDGGRIGRELLAHQQPAIAPLLGRGLGVPAGHAGSAAAAFDVAHRRVGHVLQLAQRAPQHPGRQRLALAAQHCAEAFAGGAQLAGQRFFQAVGGLVGHGCSWRGPGRKRPLARSVPCGLQAKDMRLFTPEK